MSVTSRECVFGNLTHYADVMVQVEVLHCLLCVALYIFMIKKKYDDTIPMKPASRETLFYLLLATCILLNCSTETPTGTLNTWL